jgi:predicted transposase/invertase (TIGR01784 family)
MRKIFMPKQNKSGEVKILLPKVDVIFKLLFGDKRNIEILKDFLKSVLNMPEDEYESIDLDDPHLKRERIDDKLGIVDVRLTTTTGKIVHIEIQILKMDEMPERVTYYNSKIIAAQLKSGNKFDLLQKTISIVITDYDIINDSPKYHHVFQLYDKETGIKFTDLIEINTLEMSKIPTEADNTQKYEWLRFLKAEKEEEFEMVARNNPAINKAYVVLKELSQDEKAQRLYEAREKAWRDEQSRFDSGLKKREIEIAQTMLNDGVDINTVSRYTNISLEEIKRIKENLK